MNKLIVTIAASLAVLGVVFAQVPGGFGGQEAPRPQGQGMKTGGNAASVAASGNYVYVVSGGTLYQFSVDGLKLVTKAQIPASDRGGSDGAAKRGGSGRKNNDPAK
jgi:hypothetical protein